MNKTKKLIPAIISLLLFIVMLVLVLTVDVSPSGPQGSKIGLSTFNLYTNNKLEYNGTYYDLSKACTLLLLGLFGVFCVIKLLDVIENKSFKVVDIDTWIMAIMCMVLGVLYLLFQKVIINYRPIIMSEGLEASFPSSHTLLSTAVSGYLIVYIIKHVKNLKLKITLCSIISIVSIIMIASRVLSGVHWITDIIAGVFLGLTLVFTYNGIIRMKE